MTSHDGIAGTPHRASAGRSTSRWLLPAALATLVLGTLIVIGALPFSAVLYLGTFAGMMFMHAGGHGHGGPASAGQTTHRGHAVQDANLSGRSAAVQEAASGSVAEPGDRAGTSTGSETNHDDQHGSHGCH